MFGVVLWSDRTENKAVIWCEDQGDLAFYRGRGEDTGVALDTGDWVQFDLTTERNMRFAHNPRLLAEGAYPGIADALSRPESALDDSPASPGRPQVAEVIPFRPARTATQKGAAAPRPLLA